MFQFRQFDNNNNEIEGRKTDAIELSWLNTTTLKKYSLSIEIKVYCVPYVVRASH